MSDQIQTALRCEGLGKSFYDGRSHIAVLRELTLSVTQGEMLAIVGSSGSGKSTLLHLLGGLDLPDQGSVWVAGQNLAYLTEREKGHLRNQYLGFIYQFHHLLPEFSALENVAMPLLIRGVKPRAALAQAQHLIDRVGLSDRQQHRIGALSGGERQRIAIARALVTQPKCVLSDEPTGNLDPATADQVVTLMRHLNQEMQTSFIIVTHHHPLATSLDRMLLLEEGCLHAV